MNASELNGGDRPILVVDDNASIREALRELLEVEGYPVAEAENGRVALERLRVQPTPSLVILDLIMPVMTGTEFLWAARIHSACPRVPIMVLSAVPGISWAARYADCALPKPVDADVLLRAVADLHTDPAVRPA
jgi:CheY-like chemotaxis protein